MSIKIIFVIAMVCSILIPLMAVLKGARERGTIKKALAGNIISFFTLLIGATAFMFTTAHAANSETVGEGMKFLSAALSTGMSSLGAGVAVAAAASAALGAMSENEGIMGKALIFVALAEGIALYGLLVSFVILSK